MGFLRRFLSLGSKKNKKQQRPQIIHNVPLDPNNQLDADAAVNQLLRSSSARYRVVDEVDYTSLPPLPHPINNVVQSTPSASTISLATTDLSQSQRGTYSVRVHKREYITRAQVGDAFTAPNHQDKDTSQLLRLRSDPSVASLLDMYDEHGRVCENAFSNSPPVQGKAQTRRSGSTLRQLLGGTPKDTDGSESDISWAERYLQETDATSSVSSIALQTPNDFDHHFQNDPLISPANDDSFPSDHDLSNISDTVPVSISSMEVELSIGTDAPPSVACSIQEQVMPDIHKTPRRASQVFDFLASKRRSQIIETDRERPLPDPPSTFSSPSDQGDSPRSQSRSRFSSNSSCEAFSPSAIEIHNNTNNDTPRHAPAPPVKTRIPSPDIDQSHEESVIIQEAAQARKVKIIMTNPTTVMVTAPTPSTNTDADGNMPATRIPRGPRSQTRKASYGNLKTRRPTSPRKSDDPFTAIPSRRRKSRSRITSQSSNRSSLTENDPPPTIRPIEKYRVASKEKHARSSEMRLNAKPDLPLTPIRTNTHRSLLKSAIDGGLFEAPSPASSSEMSPVGQRIMMDVRRAKASERQKSSKMSRYYQS